VQIVGLNHITGPIPILTPMGLQNAVFGRQIRTTPMAASGDSGALVCDMNYGVAIGMIFAGGTTETLLNDIKEVESALGVVIAFA
jgi:hypothetical protein